MTQRKVETFRSGSLSLLCPHLARLYDSCPSLEKTFLDFVDPLGLGCPFAVGKCVGPILWHSHLTVLTGLFVNGTGFNPSITEQITSHLGGLIWSVN